MRLPHLSDKRSECAAACLRTSFRWCVLNLSSSSRHEPDDSGSIKCSEMKYLENNQAIAKRLAKTSRARVHDQHHLQPTTVGSLLYIPRSRVQECLPCSMRGGVNRRVADAVRTLIIAYGAGRTIAASCSPRCDIYMQLSYRVRRAALKINMEFFFVLDPPQLLG